MTQQVFWQAFIRAVSSVSFLIVVVLIVRHLATKSRVKYVASHSLMSDEDFLGRLGLSEGENKRCFAIRAAVAWVAKVPAASLHPDDTMVSIFNLGSDGIGLLEISWAMEKELGVKVDLRKLSESFQGINRMGMTFADFVKHLICHWDQVTPQGASSAKN